MGPVDGGSYPCIGNGSGNQWVHDDFDHDDLTLSLKIGRVHSSVVKARLIHFLEYSFLLYSVGLQKYSTGRLMPLPCICFVTPAFTRAFTQSFCSRPF